MHRPRRGYTTSSVAVSGRLTSSKKAPHVALLSDANGASKFTFGKPFWQPSESRLMKHVRTAAGHEGIPAQPAAGR